MQPWSRQKRDVNCRWNFEFVPIPSSLIAIVFTSLKPACEKSTAERRIENGSASTTWS